MMTQNRGVFQIVDPKSGGLMMTQKWWPKIGGSSQSGGPKSGGLKMMTQKWWPKIGGSPLENRGVLFLRVKHTYFTKPG